ncbi:RidA family protein [Paracoccus onubensis]|uniref:RidA family protein n=1 Tax=Paracoccus onubensis TaxID=1675788 RepID=UPI0027320714|nr:RidA family protein [Paracoccus onubensis]MDP0928478.1 RidA family protein [Paracoccus onubensis]
MPKSLNFLCHARALVCILTCLAGMSGASFADEQVSILNPQGAINPTGTWSVASKAGEYVFVAGMRGIDPQTGDLVEDNEERIRQGFENMLHIAASEGGDACDTVRLVVYVTDMYRYRPLVNQVQEELWIDCPFPPRTIVEVDRLNDDDIFEVEGTFYIP